MGADSTTTIQIDLKSTADTSGVQQMRSQYDDLFDGLKQGVADALNGQGVDSKFVSHVVDEFDRLNRELQETGASGDVVAEKIGKLQERLQAAAAEEEKRVRQIKTNFEAALAEKDAEQDALALTRRRREEDQLAVEQEALAARRRIAALQEEREMATSVAQARQMSAEQRIERGVLGQGAYDPREDVERLKQVDAQTSRNIAGMGGYKGSVGDAALAFAYFADDAQYGLRGIMNNIPQLALMLGLGSGLAGAISVAAIAVNFLWEKFGGAKEAAAKTDEAKKRTEELTTAINAASESASQMFQQSFDVYLNGLREATDLWDKQKSHISEALTYQNELAKAEQAAAQAKLEIERQTKLAMAKSDEERQSINAEYDGRKAGIDGKGKAEAMQRALESQALSEGSLKARIGDAQAAKNSAQQTVNDLNDASQGILGGIGQESDQARRNRERIATEARIKSQEDEMRERLQRQSGRSPFAGGTEGIDYKNEQAKIDALQKALSEAYKQRDDLGITRDADQAALKTGKGVTFEQAKGASKEASDNVSLQKYTQAEQQLKDNAEASAKASQIALEAEKTVAALTLEISDLQHKTVLLKKQQVALQAEEAAAFAKAGADKVAADQKADEQLRKKQIEEQARKLENDAVAAEQKGDFKGAAKKRNQAERVKLPDNATPEQQRKAELDAQARVKEAEHKQTLADQKKTAQDIGTKGSNLGANLGEAGKGLKEAADKLKDGATEKELEEVLSAFKGLSQTAVSKFQGQEKKFSALWNEIKTLQSQLQNMRGGAGS